MVVFADETDVNLLPPVGSQWTQVAHQPRADTPGTNRKRYAFGAVDPHFGRLFWRVARRKRSREFAKFLRQLLREVPEERIVVIADNYKIHDTSRVDKVVAEAQGRLQLVFLPTYSPWLNPIELLWRHKILPVLRNHLYPNIRATLRGILERFRELAQRPDQVLQVIGADTTYFQVLA